MPDYIVTEVVTYRVTDVDDEEAAIRAVEESEDRDSMFEACLDREAVCISEPIDTGLARAIADAEARHPELLSKKVHLP